MLRSELCGMRDVQTRGKVARPRPERASGSVPCPFCVGVRGSDGGATSRSPFPAAERAVDAAQCSDPTQLGCFGGFLALCASRFTLTKTVVHRSKGGLLQPYKSALASDVHIGANQLY